MTCSTGRPNGSIPVLVSTRSNRSTTAGSAGPPPRFGADGERVSPTNDHRTGSTLPIRRGPAGDEESALTPRDGCHGIPAPPAPPPAIVELRRELERAERYAESALAPSTRRAYEHDWWVFATWCSARGLHAIPAKPESVAAFLAAEADREFRPVTISRL